MKTLILNWIKAFIYPRPILGIFHLPKYVLQFISYRKNNKEEEVKFIDTYPCLLDSTTETSFDAHYFYQSAWLSRRIFEIKPEYHVDIGSSVMMISVMSSFVKTIFVDYRPLKTDITDLSPVGGNITSLPFLSDSIESLSCLHVIEHIGLGRYGDPIDNNGTNNAAKELQRVLKVNGYLYLSLPVGRERVCFNAHRVLSPETVVKLFPDLKLIEFSYINDDRNYIEFSTPDDATNNEYACGLFVFRKN